MATIWDSLHNVLRDEQIVALRVQITELTGNSLNTRKLLGNERESMLRDVHVFEDSSDPDWMGAAYRKTSMLLEIMPAWRSGLDRYSGNPERSVRRCLELDHCRQKSR